MVSPAPAASRQQHWFSTAGHSLDLASFVPSLGPSQQAETREAAALACRVKPFLFACTRWAAAVLHGPQRCQFLTSPTCWALQWVSVQNSQGFFFPLHKKKQIIIETSDFMFKDSEGETSKARPGSNFKISLQSPLACKQHKVLGLEKIIDQPSRRFFVQFGKETFE